MRHAGRRPDGMHRHHRPGGHDRRPGPGRGRGQRQLALRRPLRGQRPGRVRAGPPVTVRTVAAWDVLAAGGGRRTSAGGGRTAAPSPALGCAASVAAKNAAGLGQNEKRWAWRQPGGVDHRQAGAVRRPAASSTALNTGFRGWPDSLGLGNTTSQTGNPGWLINRDINATPTAGGRPDLVEARVLAVPDGDRPCEVRTRPGRGGCPVTLWHVCGTPPRPPTAVTPHRFSLGARTRALMSAPSAIRTRDLLLRRHSPDVAR